MQEARIVINERSRISVEIKVPTPGPHGCAHILSFGTVVELISDFFDQIRNVFAASLVMMGARECTLCPVDAA